MSVAARRVSELDLRHRTRGHRDRFAIGWLIILIGLFSFLWFLATLTPTVRRISGDAFLANATAIGRAIYGRSGSAGHRSDGDQDDER